MVFSLDAIPRIFQVSHNHLPGGNGGSPSPSPLLSAAYTEVGEVEEKHGAVVNMNTSTVQDKLIISKVKIPTAAATRTGNQSSSSRINGTIAQNNIESAKIVAVSPDGTRIAIGGKDGEVMLFEPINITTSANSISQSESPPLALPIPIPVVDVDVDGPIVFQGPSKIWVHSLVFSADSSILLAH